jgi:hypothetical protein
MGIKISFVPLYKVVKVSFTPQAHLNQYDTYGNFDDDFDDFM